MLTHLERMGLRVETLFTSDAAGRVLRWREPGGALAPRFYLGRSPHGNLWRFRGDLPSPVLRELSRLAGKEPPLRSDSAPPERLAAFRRVLAGGALDGGAGREYRVFAHYFPDDCAGLVAGDLNPGAPLSGAELQSLRDAGDGAEVLQAGLSKLISEVAERQPCFAIVAGGRAACVCCSAQLLAGEPTGALGSILTAEARVEILPEQRGVGFALRAVAAWARAVRERGGLPHFSCSPEDKTSQSMARELGLVPFGEDLRWS